jgi:hypothetical protein
LGGLGFRHLLRMPLAVEEDEPPDPMDEDLFRARVAVPDAHRLANLIE